MNTTDYRDGSVNTQIFFAISQCNLGAILVALTKRGICAIFFGDDPDVLARELQDQFPRATFIAGDKKFQNVITKVIVYVDTPKKSLRLPLDERGTDFQQRVWQTLREVPLGKTITYTEIAERIGAPKAVRAVANACGSNKIAVAIPCHRAVRKDGKLGGYRWGIERKRALLEKEQKR